MLFAILFILVLIGVILSLPLKNGDSHTHARTSLGVLDNTDHIELLKKARISPSRLFVEEMKKEDKWISGVWGVSSSSFDIRSPYQITSYNQQNEVQDILNKLKTAMSESEYIKLRTEMEEKASEYNTTIDNILTKNQIQVLESITNGQAIPTVVAGDALEDEKLTYDEIVKLFPQFKTMEQKPTIFNHKQFSIQTRPGSTEKAIEASFQ